MKKHAILLLAVLLLASCQNHETVDTGADRTVVETQSEAVTEAVVTYDHLPDDLDLGGYDFRVLTFEGGNTESWNGWLCYIDVESENGDILNDAAYRRNMEVEERLGVTISCYEDAPAGEVLSHLSKTVFSGEDLYDFVIPNTWEQFTSLITGGMLYDVMQLDYVELSQPYYNQNANEVYRIADQQYMVSGVYTYPMYSVVPWLFNKELWSSYDLDDPYQAVRDGTWTMSYAMSVMKDTYRDLNGNNILDEDDIYGFSAHPVVLQYLYAGMGMHGVIYEEDHFSYDYDDEKAANALNLLLDLRNSKDALYLESGQEISFFNGRSLMHLYASNLPRLRDISCDFGMLPMPKYDESQETYSSYVGGGLACVPATIQNPEYTGAVIEALFSGSEQYLKEPFFDKFVETKVLRDADSVEMFDIIYRDAAYNFTTHIVPVASLSSFEFVNKLITRNSTDIGSEWEKIRKNVEKGFDKFLEKMGDPS